MYTTRTFFLLLVLTAAVAGSGHAVAGLTGLTVALAAGVAGAIACWRYADRFLLGLYDARQVPYADSPLLYRTLQKLAIRAAIPMPRLYVIPERAPNAFATGRDADHASIAVTEGMLRLLNEWEIEAVLAHEVARIARGDMQAASVVAAVAGGVGAVVQFTLWGTANRVAAWLQLLLARAIRLRDRNLEADRKGATLTANPLALASALEKMDAYSRQMAFYGGSRETGLLFIQNPFPAEGADAVRTHPRTRERVSQLWQMARNLRIAA